jgi:hypothetical protein
MSGGERNELEEESPPPISDDDDADDEAFEKLPPRWQTRIRKLRRDCANYRTRGRDERAGRIAAEELYEAEKTRNDELEAATVNETSDLSFKLGLESALAVVGKVPEPRRFINGFREHLKLDATGRPVLPTPRGDILFAAVLPITGSGGQSPRPFDATGTPRDPREKFLMSQKQFESEEARKLGYRK